MTPNKSFVITMFLVGAAWLSAAPAYGQFSLLEIAEGPMASTGSAAFGIESADLDGDGKPDIVSSFYGSGNVNVFRNISTGAGPMQTIFDAPIDITYGTGAAYNVAIADLNKDYKPEILIANTALAEVTILPNHSTPGVINFGTAVHIPCPETPYALTACDLNMDAYGDLIVTCNSKLAIYRNTTVTVGGDISFDPYSELIEATTWRDVMCADMDGDARVDIVAGGSDRVAIFQSTTPTGGTTLSFAAPVTCMTARNTYTMDIGDLDGDFQPDIVTANWPSPDFTLIRNATTPGTLSLAAPQYITAVSPPGIALGDFDSDGKLDVITMVDGMGWNLAEAFRNTTATPGVITFAAPQTFTPVSDKVIVDDFDGDGADDFAGVNDASNHVSVWVHDNMLLANHQPQVTVYCGEDANAWIEFTVDAKSTAEYFIVERTVDGQHFEQVAKISAQAGSASHTYEVTDPHPAWETVYYRILTFDATEKQVVSSLYPLSPCNTLVTDFTCVFPNPVGDVMNFKFSITAQTEMHMQVLDMSMKKKIQKVETVTNGTRTYSLDVRDLPKGSYIFLLRFGNLPPHLCQFEKL